MKTRFRRGQKYERLKVKFVFGRKPSVNAWESLCVVTEGRYILSEVFCLQWTSPLRPRGCFCCCQKETKWRGRERSAPSFIRASSANRQASQTPRHGVNNLPSLKKSDPHARKACNTSQEQKPGRLFGPCSHSKNSWKINCGDGAQSSLVGERRAVRSPVTSKWRQMSALSVCAGLARARC